MTRLASGLKAVRNLGVEVKGLWLADFDSGDGYYYCWKLGEDDIEHFHRYETGFAGRRPISLRTADGTAPVIIHPGVHLPRSILPLLGHLETSYGTKHAPISARHAAEEMRPSRIAVSCP